MSRDVSWHDRYGRLGEALDQIEAIDGIEIIEGPSDIKGQYDEITAATIEIGARSEVDDNETEGGATVMLNGEEVGTITGMHISSASTDKEDEDE